MDLRDVMLVLHIAGAGIWLGANVVQAVVPTMAARQGAAAAAGWFRVAGQLSNKLYLPVAILILLTGVVLVAQDDSYGFTSSFVLLGFGMIVVGVLLGSFVFDPGSKLAAAAVELADPGAIKKTVGRLATFGTIDTLLLLFTMTTMVLRLGA